MSASCPPPYQSVFVCAVIPHSSHRFLLFIASYDSFTESKLPYVNIALS